MKVMNEKSDAEISRIINMAKSPEYEVCVWGVGKIGTGAGKALLEDIGVKIDFYCDSNPEMVNHEICRGLLCKSSDYLFNNMERIVCFVLVGYIYGPEVLKMLNDHRVPHIISYDDLLNYDEVSKRWFPFLSKKSIAVYTCIVDGYDDVIDHCQMSENCDCFIISDKKPEISENSTWIDVRDVVPDDITDPVFQNRYCKMHADLLFPDYRYSIYHDGNVEVFSAIEKAVYSLGKARIGVLNKYERDTIVSQALRYRFQKLDYDEKWCEQIRRYFLEGVPLNMRVFLCNVLIREHNNPICRKLMDDWWIEFRNGVRRDQISFPYILWKNGFAQEDVTVLSELFCEAAIGKNSYWNYTPAHKKERFYV